MTFYYSRPPSPLEARDDVSELNADIPITGHINESPDVSPIDEMPDPFIFLTSQRHSDSLSRHGDDDGPGPSSTLHSQPYHHSTSLPRHTNSSSPCLKMPTSSDPTSRNEKQSGPAVNSSGTTPRAYTTTTITTESPPQSDRVKHQFSFLGKVNPIIHAISGRRKLSGISLQNQRGPWRGTRPGLGEPKTRQPPPLSGLPQGDNKPHQMDCANTIPVERNAPAPMSQYRLAPTFQQPSKRIFQEQTLGWPSSSPETTALPQQSYLFTSSPPPSPPIERPKTGNEVPTRSCNSPPMFKTAHPPELNKPCPSIANNEDQHDVHGLSWLTYAPNIPLVSRFSMSTYAPTELESTPATPKLANANDEDNAPPVLPTTIKSIIPDTTAIPTTPVAEILRKNPMHGTRRKPTPHQISSENSGKLPLKSSQEPADRIQAMQFRLDHLARRRRNIDTIINELTQVIQPSSVEYDMAIKDEVKRAVRSLDNELADIKREEHDLAMIMFRAQKKRNEKQGMEPPMLWVKRVTS